ncbi:hypothetical protein MOD54_08535 [Bacillus spizizenii]|nr:hypothetical protein [Bacillus spizizenii]MCY8107307.1 hypothetical protein [Bacillus spizizenii]MCY8253676.1 hypothetical protein [Bacillus spizizenii]MCY8304912.1 hypothetical protein [Bacillus spizizenii]MCY8657162.1 hypothetical protein [Bacillus spizizenii]
MVNELYSNMGFISHPFSRYSAEEEEAYLKEIFNKPNYFSALYGDIKDGNSRFIYGERGIGKTALVYSLKDELETNQYFVVNTDSYDGIALVNNNVDLIKEVLQRSVTLYSIGLEKNRHLLKNLNKHEKEKLSFFIEYFFTSLSTSEYREIYNKATRYKTKNFFKNIFNTFLLKPTNIAISGLSDIASTTISKSLGLPTSSADEIYRSYIPEIQTVKVTSIQKDLSIFKYEDLKRMLKDFFQIVKNSGFKNSVIFFDKIDEFSRLQGNVNKISDFIQGLVVDTDLLQMKGVSFVFLIWNKVKGELNASGGRYDKFKPQDINWTKEQLREILNKRVSHFSNGRVFIDSLFEDVSQINDLVELSNKSPRHLIVLFSRIYDEQSKENTNVTVFSNESVSRGIETFIRYFDYHSLHPGKPHTQNYIKKVVNRILRMGKIQFEVKDIVSEFKVSSEKANTYIQAMKNYALIKDIDRINGKFKRYEVSDPKLIYAIKHNILKINED